MYFSYSIIAFSVGGRESNEDNAMASLTIFCRSSRVVSAISMLTWFLLSIIFRTNPTRCKPRSSVGGSSIYIIIGICRFVKYFVFKYEGFLLPVEQQLRATIFRICYKNVTLLLQICYTLSKCCYKNVTYIATLLLQICCILLKSCYKNVTHIAVLCQKCVIFWVGICCESVTKLAVGTWQECVTVSYTAVANFVWGTSLHDCVTITKEQFQTEVWNLTATAVSKSFRLQPKVAHATSVRQRCRLCRPHRAKPMCHRLLCSSLIFAAPRGVSRGKQREVAL